MPDREHLYKSPVDAPCQTRLTYFTQGWDYPGIGFVKVLRTYVYINTYCHICQ